MANKPFQIQGSTLSIGGVELNSSADGKVVIPGVTRASSYQAYEVEDTGDQTQTWTDITVIDNGFYEQLVNPDLSLPVGWTAASYLAEIDGDGYIDKIEVTVAGALWNQLNVTNATADYMWAGAFPDGTYDFNNFNAGDWTQIPFTVKVQAGSIESEFSSGGGSTADVNFSGSTLESDSSGNFVNLDVGGDEWMRLGTYNDNKLQLITGFDSNNNIWEFGTDGSLKFPDGTIQTTAYGGVELPSWLTEISGTDHLPTYGVDYGWDTNGVWFTNATVGFSGDGPEGTSYPVRTAFTLGTNDVVSVTVTFKEDDENNDFGLCFFEDGTDPEWQWGSNSTRIACQYNGLNPNIKGKNSENNNPNGFDLTVASDQYYKLRATYDPTSAVTPGNVLITMETLDLNDTVLDSFTYEETALGGPFRIGFAADNDPAANRTYMKDLTISIMGGSVYTDTLTNAGAGLGNLRIATWGYPGNDPVRLTHKTAGESILVQSSGDGRSSLRWHVRPEPTGPESVYSQVDVQTDGVWVKNADWGTPGYSHYWHFDNSGGLVFPDGTVQTSAYAGLPKTYLLDDYTESSIGTQGNQVLTANGIPYNNFAVTSGDFGPGSKNVSMYSTSIFAMVGVACDISALYYNGEFGADGDGTKTVSTLFEGSNYNGFYAGMNQLYGAQDPNITQVIIHNKSNGVTFQNLTTNTNNDDFYATGLQGASVVAALTIYGSDTENAMSLEDVEAIVNGFIDVVLNNGTIIDDTNIGTRRDDFYTNISTIIEGTLPGVLQPDFDFFTKNIYVEPTGGNGTGASFEIVIDADVGGNSFNYHTEMYLAGTGYQAGDTLTILGSLLPNGSNGTHDITITVDSVNIAGGIEGWTDTSNATPALDTYPAIDGQRYVRDGKDDQYDRGNFISTSESRKEIRGSTTYNDGYNGLLTLTVTNGDALLPGEWIYFSGPNRGAYVVSDISSAFDNTLAAGDKEVVLNTDGSITFPTQSMTGYYSGYSISGPTLQLGNDPTVNEVIITGPAPDANNAYARRLVIQGQKGWGGEFQTKGEGGDVYIWAGTGGDAGAIDHQGGGGDVKVRGGQGGGGGYVKIEGGDATAPAGTGGRIEITAGSNSNTGGNGGDVIITAGEGNLGAGGNNGEVHVYTQGNVNHWKFDNAGTLHLPEGGNIVDFNGSSVLGSSSANLVGDGFTEENGYQYTIYTDYYGYQGGEADGNELGDWIPPSTPVAIGDTITFRGGETALVTDVVDEGTYIDISWDTAISGSDSNPRYPITITSSDYTPAVKNTARIKPDSAVAAEWDQYMEVYAGQVTQIIDSRHIHMAGATGDVELFLGTDNNFVSVKEAGTTAAGVNLQSENDITVTDSNLRLKRKGGTWASIYGDGYNINNHNNNYDLAYNVITSDDEGNLYVGGEATTESEAIVSKYSSSGELLWTKHVNGYDINGWQIDGIAYHNGQVATAVMTSANRNYDYYKLTVHDSETGEVVSTTDVYDADGNIEVHKMIHHTDLGWVMVGNTGGEYLTTSTITSTGNTGTGIIELPSASTKLNGQYPVPDANWYISGSLGLSIRQPLSSGVGMYQNVATTIISDTSGNGAEFDVVANAGDPGVYTATVRATISATISTVDLATASVSSGSTIVINADNIVTPGGWGNWLVFPAGSVATALLSLYTTNQVVPVVWGAGSTALTGYVTFQDNGDGTVQFTPVQSDGGAAIAGTWYFPMSFTSPVGGTQYPVGRNIKILGTALGGATPANDLTITVTSIDGTGSITGISVSGTADGGAETSYPAVSSGTNIVGSGATLTVYKDYNANTYGLTSVTNGGQNYANGDQITVLGSLLGGVDGGSTISADVVSSGLVDNTIVAYFNKVTYPDLFGALNWASYQALYDSGSYDVLLVEDSGENWKVTIDSTNTNTGGTILFNTLNGNDIRFTASASSGSLIGALYGVTGTPNRQLVRFDMGYSMGYTGTDFTGGTFTIEQKVNQTAFVWTSSGLKRVLPPYDANNNSSNALCVAADYYGGSLIIGGYTDSNNNGTGFIWKLATNGVTEWAKSIDSENDSVRSVAAGPLTGDIYASTNWTSIYKISGSGTLVRRAVPNNGMWGVNAEIYVANEEGTEYVYVGGRGGANWMPYNGFMLNKLTTSFDNIWGRNLTVSNRSIDTNYDLYHNTVAFTNGQATLAGYGYVNGAADYDNAILATISTADEFVSETIGRWTIQQNGTQVWTNDFNGFTLYDLSSQGITAASGSTDSTNTDSLTWTNYQYQTTLVNLNWVPKGIKGVERINFADGGLLEHNPAIIPPSVGFDGNDNWNYTLQLSDIGRFILNQTIPNDSYCQDVYITVPKNQDVPFPVGTVITLINASSSDYDGYRIYVDPDNYGSSDAPRIWATGFTGNSTWSFQGMQTATLMKISTNGWLLTANSISNED